MEKSDAEKKKKYRSCISNMGLLWNSIIYWHRWMSSSYWKVLTSFSVKFSPNIYIKASGVAGIKEKKKGNKIKVMTRDVAKTVDACLQENQ